MRGVSHPNEDGEQNHDEGAYEDYDFSYLFLPLLALFQALLSCLGVHSNESLEPIIDLA